MKDLDLIDILKILVTALKNRPSFLFFLLFILIIIQGIPNIPEQLALPLVLISMTSGIIVIFIDNNSYQRFKIINEKLDFSTKLLAESDESNLKNVFPPSYQEDIINANEIIQVGIHLSSDLNTNYSCYRKMLENEGRLKILVVDPKGEAIKMAAMRFPGNINPNQEIARLNNSLENLTDLMEEFDTIEVRILDYLFAYSILYINPDSKSSILYVERYTFKTMGGSNRPKHVYNQNTQQWFELFTSEISDLWKLGKTFNPIKKGDLYD